MDKQWLGLEDEVAIVTGAASGIGRHVAEILKSVGAKVVVADLTVETGDELNVKDFDLMFNVNVKGLFLVAQVCARQMIKQGKGVIVNMSSASGKEGSVGQSAYSATKGAVDSFTRSWGKEISPYGVRVVAVAPDIMEATGLRTPAYEEALAYTRGTTPDKLNTDYKKSIPLGRPGKLDEVAWTVAFLASDRGGYITGTTINVSGGKSRG